MIEGSNLLKMVQEKLAEKEEVIREQHRQIEDLQKKLAEAGDTAESEAVILEQMQQLMELTEKLEQAEAKGKEDALALEEKEEV
ncbi:MAG TPA: hypothetical protein PK988_12430, partial [Candidatus Sumerlaeota bacterium]|nr:hypothetical protein [Candidatus Sumerlaeota bacterium]